MVGKLLKYEIPALSRRLVPLYIGWAATAVLLGLAVGPFSSKSGFMIVLTSLMYSAVAAAVLVMAVIMIIQRYSNSLLGDEAYFNQVLPVTAAEHIASKAVSALVWVLFSMIVMALTGIIIALFSGFLFDVNIPWTEIFHTIARAGFGEWLAFLQFILLSVISITKSVLAIYTAVTVGHQAQNHTTLASIGAYIGVLVFEALAARVFMTPMQNLFTNVDSAAKLNLGLLVLTLLTLALGAVYFFLCKYFMENKLNLD